MIRSGKWKQLVPIAAAAGLFVAAGLLQRPLSEQADRYEINPREITENQPGKTVLTMAPGGLRAPIVNYLWIRADSLKNEGRHYEAMQLADMICRLQPNYPGVWAFHAWNMAWNISVTTHTPEERWLWVSNGVRLLRDEGIPQNRDALVLYKELAWIFWQKMGQYLDDMHMVYKQRWASQMQRLLASPPYGTTEEVLAWFAPVAEAPLDKDFRRQGRDTIQADQLRVLLSDAPLGEYASNLAAYDVGIDQSLLAAYNRYSTDLAVALARPPLETPPRETPRDQALYALINDPDRAAERLRLLSFVRAQVLWNVYRLDPDWMHGLMLKYGPLDWRQPSVHAIYWATYGLHVTESRELGDVNSLNTDRIVLYGLQDMTWNGRMTYIENPADPDAPLLTFTSDWRFIGPTQDEFLVMTNMSSRANDVPYAQNLFRSGHVNYLINAIQMLYAGYRRDRAQSLFEWIKEHYHPTGPEWDMDLDEFVYFTLTRDGPPIARVALSQISSALQTAFLMQAGGSTPGYRESLRHALRVYRIFQDSASERTRLPEFQVLVRDTLANLLVQPRLIGVNLPLVDRSHLYTSVGEQLQRQVYPLVERPLRELAQAAGLDFDQAFPAPSGLGEQQASPQPALPEAIR